MRRLKGERTEDETANLTKKIKVWCVVAMVMGGRGGDGKVDSERSEVFQ